ncbi:recQ-mediated genome instability protein 1 [Mortierella alpina]|nr:recQ-mediated genome instability protein 1 [Mortierella alpina]
MANDDLLVRNAIERLGVNASIEWTRQCIAFHRSLDAANSATASEQDIAQFAWDMYLLADFRILNPKPILPSSIATPHKQRLFKDVGGDGTAGGGGVVLQILEIQDIGISSLKMLEACEAVGVAGDQPGGFLVEKTLPRGMISLEVTDGVRKMNAILMEPIAGIAMEMKLGAKLRVRDAEVRHGVLQLFRSNTILLGGEVASMNQHPRRLTIMNQMKKRLGLPLDPMPTTSSNTSSASETQLIARPTLHSTAPGFGTDSGLNSSKNTANNASFNSSWRNPQAAVSSLDAVPSITTLSNPQNSRNPFMVSNESEARNQIHHLPKPIRNSRSPPPPPLRSNKSNQHQEEMDPYRQLQRDQEPQWDLMQDLELEDIGLDDHADWEVMSQLSIEGSNKYKEKSVDRDSPPLIATKSPAKRGLLTRRTTSLRSPHTQHQRSQQQLLEKSRGGSWEVETNPFLDDGQTQKKSRGIEANGAEKSRRGAAGSDYFDLSRGASPLSGSSRTHSKKRPLSSSPLKAKSQLKLDLETKQDFDFQIDDAYTANMRFENGLDEDYGLLPPPTPVFDHRSTGQDDNSPSNATEWEDDRGKDVGKKRRVSPERESTDQDLFSNRRRSRSFSTSHWIEEDVKVDVKVEKDSSRYNDTLGAQNLDTAVKLEKNAATSQRSRLDQIDDLSTRVRPVSPELLSPKIKMEPEITKAKQGASNYAVIDLSSDEDGVDDNEDATSASRDRDVRGLDIHPMKIKADPEDITVLSRTKLPGASVSSSSARRSLSRSTSVQSVGQATEPLVYVKKEETLLEFDFEDGDDFGGLVERTRLIPEVELDNVKTHVMNKEEVKARARVHKLGKFSLTTQAVSIPILLLPAKGAKEYGVISAESSPKNMLEAVLEQGVVETFTELSLSEFRDLLRFKHENKVREAVGKLRTRLGMADTVECQFRGMRSGIVVIRDLKILTEKRH